jgi:hypothetical protein
MSALTATTSSPAALGQRGDRDLTVAEHRTAQATLNALLSRENRLQLALGNLLSAVGHIETAGVASQATPLMKEIQNLARIRRTVGRKITRFEELLHYADARPLSDEERAELLAFVNPGDSEESTAA